MGEEEVEHAADVVLVIGTPDFFASGLDTIVTEGDGVLGQSRRHVWTA